MQIRSQESLDLMDADESKCLALSRIADQLDQVTSCLHDAWNS